MSVELVRAVESMDKTQLSIEEIQALIPHRYPMLMLDKVIDIKGDESGTGIKNVSGNEPFFVGHFPGKPVMPGVLIVEAMAQTSAVLVINSLDAAASSKLVYFMSVDEARFRHPVLPGDCLELKVEKTQNRSNVWKYKAKALVDDKVHAEAAYMAMLVDKE